MPDCSYVTLTVAASDGDRVAALLDETGRGPSGDWETGSDERQFEFEEAAWGVSFLTEEGWGADRDLLALLRGEGIGYVASDGGHYTWDPFEWAWAPGMTEPVRRSNGVEGSPVLGWPDWVAARERISDPGELVAWVEAYFGSDPAGWVAAGPTGVES